MTGSSVKVLVNLLLKTEDALFLLLFDGTKIDYHDQKHFVGLHPRLMGYLVC